MSSGAVGPEFVVVDGETMIPVPRSAIAPPATHFGQVHRWEGEGHTPLFFSCAMHTPVFISLVDDWFAAWREDMIADFENDPPHVGSAEAHWKGLGTPGLESLIHMEPILASHLLLPYALDLCQLLGAQGSSPIRYCMMSVDGMVISPSAVRMDGVAVRVG